MTVTDVRTDREARTLTLTADFAASPEDVWRLWEDPRLLERWWGPPTYPATVVDHNLTTGGRVSYYMTSPEGEKYHGWWHVRSVEPPTHLEFEDGFADDQGDPNSDLPTTITRVTVQTRADGGTRMTVESSFPSLEAMEQMAEMGMEEGMRLAMGQMDALLAEQSART